MQSRNEFVVITELEFVYAACAWHNPPFLGCPRGYNSSKPLQGCAFIYAEGGIQSLISRCCAQASPTVPPFTRGLGGIPT